MKISIPEENLIKTVNYIVNLINYAIDYNNVKLIIQSYIYVASSGLTGDYIFSLPQEEKNKIIETVKSNAVGNFSKSQVELVLNCIITAYSLGYAIKQIALPNQSEKELQGMKEEGSKGSKTFLDNLADTVGSVFNGVGNVIGKTLEGVLKGVGLNFSINDFLMVGALIYLFFYYMKAKQNG